MVTLCAEKHGSLAAFGPLCRNIGLVDPEPETDRRIIMLSRRSVVFAAVAVTATLAAPAVAAETKAFNPDAFAAAQQAGKPILVAVHASWCPICKAQKPILSELMDAPKFKDLVYFVVDFDSQKDVVGRFGVRMQSTLIAFKGQAETGRSVGERDRTSIAALLDKTL
jgi:thioredoxin 1